MVNRPTNMYTFFLQFLLTKIMQIVVSNFLCFFFFHNKQVCFYKECQFLHYFIAKKWKMWRISKFCNWLCVPKTFSTKIMGGKAWTKNYLGKVFRQINNHFSIKPACCRQSCSVSKEKTNWCTVVFILVRIQPF